jgi:hypothetical protein
MSNLFLQDWLPGSSFQASGARPTATAKVSGGSSTPVAPTTEERTQNESGEKRKHFQKIFLNKIKKF